MKMIIFRISLFVFIFFTQVTIVFSQDAIFSQHFASPLYLNPAFAGSDADYRIVMNYRNQPFPDLGTFSTMNVAFDVYAPQIYGGLGLIVTSDNQGSLLMKNTISGIYAFHLKAADNLFVNFGAQAGYHRKDMNWNNLIFANDAERPPDQTWIHAVDFAAGVLIYNDWMYGGLAAHHLNQPRESFYGDYKLPIKYTAHFGVYLEPTDNRRAHTQPFDYFFSPNIIVQNQGDFFRINYGFYTGMQSVMAGVWYRQDLTNPSTLIFLVGMNVRNYRIGYSYDYSLSGYSRPIHGAHEISVSILFDNEQRKLRKRVLNCPGF